MEIVMNLFKCTMLSLTFAATTSFLACSDDDSSSPSEPKDDSSPVQNSTSEKFDCTVTDGVKVVSPKGGETFKMGDTITVVFGSDISAGGFGIVFKTNLEDKGYDMTETSVGPESPDGKSCYTERVVLSDDYAEPTKSALIRVYPYAKQAKGANSKEFVVTE